MAKLHACVCVYACVLVYDAAYELDANVRALSILLGS